MTRAVPVPDKLADLIAAENDPLRDVTELERVRFVVPVRDEGWRRLQERASRPSPGR